MEYEALYKLFDEKRANINDTSFRFRSDPEGIERFMGFQPRNGLPYWLGYCDVEGGCNFKTAAEMFEAPVFGGRSVKDRWVEVELITIGAIDIDEWSPDLCPPDN